jgi:AraC-like DNA-binding protein
VPLVAVSVGNAMLFWLFVQALFDDDFRLHLWHGGLWAAVAGLAGFNCAVMAGSHSVLAPVTWGLQRAVPLVFAVLAAVSAARNRQADLVEDRRRLRRFIVVTGVAYTVVMLLVRLAAPRGRLSPDTALVDVLLMLGMVAVIAWRLLRLTPTELFPSAAAGATGLGALPVPRSLALPGAPLPGPAAPAQDADPADPPPPLPPPDAAEQRLADALQRLMATDRAYRTEDLTLAALASRLAVPEYRLRRLINQRLGHRNFNAFVNGWRLAEARAALADPKQRDLPVLSIALEAGFQSIGPFNRAFKAATGLTPTEFRRENMADS